MPWITTKEGKHINTDWFDKERQIADNEFESAVKNKDGRPHNIKIDDATLTYMILKNKPNSIYIYDLKVPEVFREKGVGTSLLERIKHLADSKNMEIMLDAYPTRTSHMSGEQLIKWYEKRGFKHVGANQMVYSSRVDTEQGTKEKQIAENKRQADEKNNSGWDYRGISERTDKLEAALKNARSANKIQVVAQKLKQQDALITEELKRIDSGKSDVKGDKNALLTQRRKVRLLMKKAKI